MSGQAIRIALLTTLTAAALSSAAAPGVAFAQRQAGDHTVRVGVQSFGPASLPDDLRARLNDAAATGLRGSGTEVLPTSEVDRVRINAELGECTDQDCEKHLGKLTDVRYWLRGTCLVDGSTYRLQMELVDVKTGGVRAARDDTCDICTEADAGETTRVGAAALKTALGRASGSAASAHGAWSNAGAPRAQQQQSTGMPLWRRLLPWAAFTAAVAAGVGGAYYLAINNRGFECKGDVSARNCPYYNDTVWQWGVPLIAAGTALATTGVVLLLSGDDDDAIETTRMGSGSSQENTRRRSTTGGGSSTQIVISLDRVGLAGTF